MIAAGDRISPVVLAYHRIGRRFVLAGTWVTPRQLADHVDALRARGCRFLAPNAPADPTAAAPAVRLTFDDGTVDLLQHLDRLEARGIAGTVFVPADLLGRPNAWEWGLPGRRTRHLTASELRKLAAAGWAVGLHGARHCDLTRLDAAALADELAGGRRRLEDAIGRPVRTIAYPYGRIDARVAAAVAAAGFAAGYVLAHAPPEVPSSLARRRRPVYRTDGARDLVAKVFDPDGRTWGGRWQLWKESAAHGVGRWAARRRP